MPYADSPTIILGADGFLGRNLPPFEDDAEGVVLWACGERAGYWIAADQLRRAQAFLEHALLAVHVAEYPVQQGCALGHRRVVGAAAGGGLPARQAEHLAMFRAVELGQLLAKNRYTR